MRLLPHLLSILVTGAAAVGCGGGGGGGAASASTSAITSAAPTLTTTLTSTSSATSTTTASLASTATAPSAPVARWFAGDFHVHSSHSGDGVDGVRQTRELAKLLGLDLLAITDHSTLSHTTDPDFVSTPDLALVGGYEWTDLVHMGLIGVRTTKPELHSTSVAPADWPAYVQSLVDDAHAEGGAAILYHPTWNTFPWLFDVRGADAVEVWNNLWTLSDTGLHGSSRQDVQARLTDKGLAAAGVSASPQILAAVAAPGGGNDKALAYWEALLERGDRVAAVGGSDRHKVLPPGYPTTWVLAPSGAQADVVAALRAGRTVVTRSPRGPRVTLEADGDGDGAFEVGLGDALAAGRPATLRVRVLGGDGARLRLVRRKRVVEQVAVSSADFTFTLAWTPAPGDWIRADLFDRVDWSLPSAAPMLSATAGNLPPGGVHALFSAWGLTLATGTTWPAVALDDDLLRMANVSLMEPAWARAAITSPIYAR